MKATTELERKRMAMLKAARAAIRLKHSLRADDEIARVLPGLEEQIDTALAAGQPFELEPGAVFLVD